jgi:hypothetical protein
VGEAEEDVPDDGDAIVDTAGAGAGDFARADREIVQAPTVDVEAESTKSLRRGFQVALIETVDASWGAVYIERDLKEELVLRRVRARGPGISGE